MRIAALFLAFVACTAETQDTGDSPAPLDPFPEVEPTGVVREHTLTITPGDWTVQRDDGEKLAEVDGYHINGNFIGPTIVCDLGDTLAITVENQTSVIINLQPHGLYADQSTTRAEVAPGESIELEWMATEGAGTFYYAASHLDAKLFRSQGVFVVHHPPRRLMPQQFKSKPSQNPEQHYPPSMHACMYVCMY